MSDTLPTPRLVLRALIASDANAVFLYRSLPEVSRYQNFAPCSVDDVATFIASLPLHEPPMPGEWYQFGIVSRETEELIGDCGFQITQTDSRLAEVGITLNPVFQGCGFASEALCALLNHLFTDYDIHRIVGSVDPRNSSSMALLQRVGMRQEAHFVESYWFKGTWVDDVIFAILNREWPNNQGTLTPGPHAS